MWGGGGGGGGGGMRGEVRPSALGLCQKKNCNTKTSLVREVESGNLVG